MTQKQIDLEKLDNLENYKGEWCGAMLFPVPVGFRTSKETFKTKQQAEEWLHSYIKERKENNTPWVFNDVGVTFEFHEGKVIGVIPVNKQKDS